MYQILCDGYPLFDFRDDNLIVVNPKAKIEANTVGEASFTIYKKHPYYGMLKKLRSVFEISDEIGVIFKGRMTEDSVDFDFGKAVDLEGAMAYFNDSTIRPFNFPEDFFENDEYIAAAESGNVIQFFLKWLIDTHNSQVQDFQKFKLGKVTVSDPNNYITRSSSDYANTWETLESKLFKSELGGYLCIRYEYDGNYIDYLSEFEYTNTQSIETGENLLDLKIDSDATTTYSAIIPVGAEIEVVDETAVADDSGETEQTTTKKKLTLEDLADGDITDDIAKIGDTLYSKSAVANFGWICAPVKETTWTDVTQANNLLNKGVEYLAGTAVKQSSTTEFRAVDLHYTDEEIMSFRVYRNVRVKSAPHGIDTVYPLTKLEIDILNPQNTKITVGDTQLSLVDVNSQIQSDNMDRIEIAEKEIHDTITDITEIKNQQLTLQTKIINDCEEIILSALKSYVETGAYDDFKRTVETQLSVMAGDISMNFTTTTEKIDNVDGDLQSKFEEIRKYIKFSSEKAITIGSSDSGITLEIDNEDGIIFKKNNVPFGRWDGNDFYTGNIVVQVDERAQFGNFAFIPRSDGSLMFLKVGG